LGGTCCCEPAETTDACGWPVNKQSTILSMAYLCSSYWRFPSNELQYRWPQINCSLYDVTEISTHIYCSKTEH
jgi:hypothetical protein